MENVHDYKLMAKLKQELDLKNFAWFLLQIW